MSSPSNLQLSIRTAGQKCYEQDVFAIDKVAFGPPNKTAVP